MTQSNTTPMTDRVAIHGCCTTSRQRIHEPRAHQQHHQNYIDSMVLFGMSHLADLIEIDLKLRQTSVSSATPTPGHHPIPAHRVTHIIKSPYDFIH